MSDLIKSEQAFAASLDQKRKGSYIKVFLDEFEATLESAIQTKEMAPESLKAIRVRGEHLKRMLRLMGHHRRLPVIGGSKSVPETAADIFAEADEKEG